MADARIPKFGNWEKDGVVPYTQYFEKARKGRSDGKLVNPNDPEENPDAFSKDEPPVYAPEHRAGSDTEVSKPNGEKTTSREDGDRPSDSPIHHDPVARKPTQDLPHYRYGDRTNSGDPQRKVSKANVGSDRGTEHSPLHPHYQVKSSGKSGVSSPSRERGSSEGTHGLAPNTAGKSRFRTGGRGDDTSVKSSEVPVFGDWEKDPSSADGYTGIFNEVAKERQGGSPKVPINSSSTYLKGYKQDNSFASMNCSCFSWCKK